MNRKPISFGKISLKATNPSENEDKSGGFGTFGKSPIEEQKTIEKISEDLKKQHVDNANAKNTDKKAKQFDIEEMMEQAKAVAREKSKATEDIGSTESDEPDVIGPPAPASASDEESSDDDFIGPPIPKELLQKESNDKAEESEGK